jgi:hypothetical protein
MLRKLGCFLALAGATLFGCWSLAAAQTPMPPCLAVDSTAPLTCGTTTTSGPARYLGNSMQGMTLTPFNNYGQGQWVKFVGTDPKYGNTLPLYPTALWGGTAGYTDALQQIWTTVGQGATTEAITTDTTVPAGVSNQVLVSKMVSAYVSPNQDSYQIQPETSVAQGMAYTSRWVWLQPDAASRGTFQWILLSEFKTPDPSAERFGIQISMVGWTGYGTSTPVFNIYHDWTGSPWYYYLNTYIGPGSINSDPNGGIGQTYPCPVPLGRWFKLETAFNRSDSAGQGWFWVAITDPGSSDPTLRAGVQIFAARGPFNHTDNNGTNTLGMNMAKPGDRINRIYLHLVYSDIARSASNPYVIKMTDMQVYPGWPSNATAHPATYQ